MKKQLLFGALLVLTFSHAVTPVYAAWEKIKDEPQGVSYTDTSAYRCVCKGTKLDGMYYKIKQFPTHSNAKYIINNLRISLSGSDKYWVFNYATRYYNSGRVEDMKLPPIYLSSFGGSGSVLDIATEKVWNYCDAYCKRR